MVKNRKLLAFEVTHKQTEVVCFFHFLKISRNCYLPIRLKKKKKIKLLFQVKKPWISNNNLVLPSLWVQWQQTIHKTQGKRRLGTNLSSADTKAEAIIEVFLSLATVNISRKFTKIFHQ